MQTNERMNEAVNVAFTIGVKGWDIFGVVAAKSRGQAKAKTRQVSIRDKKQWKTK